jgi:Spy/CpxP family protein refolding chaperone
VQPKNAQPKNAHSQKRSRKAAKGAVRSHQSFIAVSSVSPVDAGRRRYSRDTTKESRLNHRSSLIILTLIGTLLGAGVAAGAQATSQPTDVAPGAPAPAEHHHASMLKMALAGLNVTPAEKAQIRAAEQKFKASKQTSTPETRAQLKADIEAALTPDQRTGFESNMKTMMAQRRAARRAGTANAPAPAAT